MLHVSSLIVINKVALIFLSLIAVNSFDIKKIKTTIDNLYLEKQKLEKGDKAKKSKGKGKARIKVEDDNVSCSH